eukprot:1153571-Pelagomonas_calceolata.AAC.1
MLSITSSSNPFLLRGLFAGTKVVPCAHCGTRQFLVWVQMLPKCNQLRSGTAHDMCADSSWPAASVLRGNSAAIRFSQKLRKHLPIPPAPCHPAKLGRLCKVGVAQQLATPLAPCRALQKAPHLYAYHQAGYKCCQQLAHPDAFSQVSPP